MTLKDKIAKALYVTYRSHRNNNIRWESLDQINKDSWRQDAQLILSVVKNDRLEEMSREHRPKVYQVDINGDQ
jgi:hypothetical protein